MKTLKNDDLACEHCYDKECTRTGDDYTYCFTRCMYYESLKEYGCKPKRRCEACNKIILFNEQTGTIVMRHYSDTCQDIHLTVCSNCFNEAKAILDKIAERMNK